MRFLYVKEAYDDPGDCYVMLARSNDTGIGYLWCLISGIITRSSRSDDKVSFATVLNSENIEGVFGAFYIFTVDSYVYIGCENDGLKPEVRPLFKDDPAYCPFRTTKQSFINLARRWIDLCDQIPCPDGIAVDEVATDVWQVKPMPEEEIRRYQEIAEPKTGFLPNDWKSKLK